MPACQDFNYIIIGYAKDRPGSRFIERGDYEVIRSQDNQTVSRSKLANMVDSGMILEMSIVKREVTVLRKDKEECPRCGRINSGIANYDWVEW